LLVYFWCDLTWASWTGRREGIGSASQLTRVKKGEDWSSHGRTSAAVGNLPEEQDHWRLSLAASFGLSIRSIQDQCVHSFGAERACVAEMAQWVAAPRANVSGPTGPDACFVNPTDFAIYSA
jgi:hypothetical protein